MLETSLLLSILLILVLGKLLGIVAERVGLPSLVGELLTGVILGPMLLGIVKPSDSLDFLANLGVIFMMFIMGLSIDIESVLKTNARNAASITLIGAVLVFTFSLIIVAVIGTMMGQDISYSVIQGALIGIALTSTSTVIGFKYLTDIGDRFSNVFKTLVAVEITDGVFSIMMLAVLLSIISTYKTMSAGVAFDLNSFLPVIGWSTFKLFLLMLGFMIFVIKFGGAVTDRLLGISRQTGDDQSIITFSLIVLFAVACLSDWLELTSVIGAFLAGAILAGSPFSETIIAPRIKAVGYGLFIPIFFAYTGVNMDFQALLAGPGLKIAGIGIPYYLFLFLGLLVVVMGGKYLGAKIGCALSGEYKENESNRIGFSLMCVGEDTLVMGQIGAFVFLTAGKPLITPEIFSVLGLLIIVSSLLTPIFIKRTFEEQTYMPPTAHAKVNNGSGKSKGKYKSL